MICFFCFCFCLYHEIIYIIHFNLYIYNNTLFIGLLFLFFTHFSVLDARRVDLVCGRYKCNETCNTIHEHVPLMLVIRKQLLLWFTIPMVNAAFDCLVILNTLLLVMVRVNIYFLYFLILFFPSPTVF